MRIAYRNAAAAATDADFRAGTTRRYQHAHSRIVSVSRLAPAHRFQPNSTTKNQSVGIGMAISRRVTDTHNGRLYVLNSHLGGARLASERTIAEAI